MSFMQRLTFEVQARQAIRHARRVNRTAARWRGERRFCSCGPCLRMWTVRGLALAAVTTWNLFMLGVI